MKKPERQQKILATIKARKITDQHELLSTLQAVGVVTNQATLSRDLHELNISKVSGVYQTPNVSYGQNSFISLLTIEPAGDHLIVLKLLPGQASMVAAIIDDLKLEEIVGTIAGDDAIFLATRDRVQQSTVIKKILEHFKRKAG